MAVQDRRSLVRRRWLRLKRSRFPKQGREDRIRESLDALEKAVVRCERDPDFVQWIAREGDQEDL